MIIIKSTNGDRLRLSSTRLTEIDHTSIANGDDTPTENPFYTTKRYLREALDDEVENGSIGDADIFVIGHWDGWVEGDKVHTTLVPFDSKVGRIGCKTFTPRTFNLILRTMGLLKKPVVAKKKGKGGKR